jgi:hypothetical protein
MTYNKRRTASARNTLVKETRISLPTAWRREPGHCQVLPTLRVIRLGP